MKNKTSKHSQRHYASIQQQQKMKTKHIPEKNQLWIIILEWINNCAGNLEKYIEITHMEHR